MATQGKKPPWIKKAQKRMRLLSEYEHHECGTVTSVSNDITRKSVLDPYYYGMESTFCAGCQDFVSSRECILQDGRTLYTATSELRKKSPISFKIVRFVVAPLLGALFGGAIGLLVSQNIAIAVAGGLIGFLLGFFFLSRIVATMLRGSGLLWE